MIASCPLYLMIRSTTRQLDFFSKYDLIKNTKSALIFILYMYSSYQITNTLNQLC